MLDIDAIFGLTKFVAFKIVYETSLELQFNIEDSLSALMNSKWQFIDVEGMFHKKVMFLNVQKKCPNKAVEKEVLQIVTKAIIRGKKFYDFTFTMDVKLTTKSSFGLIFRQIDAFNYYAASFSETSI